MRVTERPSKDPDASKNERRAVDYSIDTIPIFLALWGMMRLTHFIFIHLYDFIPFAASFVHCLRFICFDCIPFCDLPYLLDPFDLLSFAAHLLISMCSLAILFICLLIYESFFRIWFLWSFWVFFFISWLSLYCITCRYRYSFCLVVKTWHEESGLQFIDLSVT